MVRLTIGITCCVVLIGLLLMAGCSSSGDKDVVTTGSLLDEMLDLRRLAYLPGNTYKTFQYSSYDRSSASPEEPGWFANSDGFGEEPIPGFEKVLQEPGADGTGTYLICDIRGPGAILRLWTAAINGRIRLFLDNGRNPVFEGDAKAFFWNTINQVSDTGKLKADVEAFRQRDAMYFPIPFARRCRIEWIGNVKDIHFYHVTVRVYHKGVSVRTFRPDDAVTYSGKLNEINHRFAVADYDTDIVPETLEKIGFAIMGRSNQVVFKAHGSRAIEGLYLKIHGVDIEKALRMCILRVYFDNSSVPQVESPVGDFFGSAPGINPYRSLPFAIRDDSILVCRFIMPFKKNVRIEVENNSNEEVILTGGIKLSEYAWQEGRSMHFGAQWQIDHGLTASDSNAFDIPYFMAFGTGRIVGAAAFIYNPSPVVTSWGNWWGEGDEKVFVDDDTFPSIFGTGSEDYYNYSWSSERLFSFAYCGQSRNDGPGNRGYVSDFRWHILDDIPFREKCAFFMELLHHGVVEGFSYGRIVYYYALPGIIRDGRRISPEDVAGIPYTQWEPEAYLGSAGFSFFDAGDLLVEKTGTTMENGNIWAGDGILVWRPEKAGQSLRFRFTCMTDTLRTNIGLTLAHQPGGGEISVHLNGKPLKFDGGESISLERTINPVLQNHFSETIRFSRGLNEMIIENQSYKAGRKIGIDFLWLKGCTR